MENKHTPEPWAFDSGKIRGAMMTAKPYNIASVNGHATTEGQANGDRIIACVNACAGMSDPIQEIAWLRAQAAGIPAMCAEVERLRAIIAGEVK